MELRQRRALVDTAVAQHIGAEDRAERAIGEGQRVDRAGAHRARAFRRGRARRRRRRRRARHRAVRIARRRAGRAARRSRNRHRGSAASRRAAAPAAASTASSRAGAANHHIRSSTRSSLSYSARSRRISDVCELRRLRLAQENAVAAVYSDGVAKAHGVSDRGGDCACAPLLGEDTRRSSTTESKAPIRSTR